MHRWYSITIFPLVRNSLSMQCIRKFDNFLSKSRENYQGFFCDALMISPLLCHNIGSIVPFTTQHWSFNLVIKLTSTKCNFLCAILMEKSTYWQSMGEKLSFIAQYIRETHFICATIFYYSQNLKLKYLKPISLAELEFS